MYAADVPLVRRSLARVVSASVEPARELDRWSSSDRYSAHARHAPVGRRLAYAVCVRVLAERLAGRAYLQPDELSPHLLRDIGLIDGAHARARARGLDRARAVRLYPASSRSWGEGAP